MNEKRLVNYSIIFIALVVLGIILKTFQSALRPMSIAILLFFSRDAHRPVFQEKEHPGVVDLFRVVSGRCFTAGTGQLFHQC
jgi:hypothetical protein